MSDDKVNGDSLSPRDWMAGQMMLAVRDVEKRFEGADVTVFVSAPGAAKGSPQFNYASTAEIEDVAAVVRSWLAENKK